jgi:signal transduction histidine kinase/CheY-like chemotaxis protein
MRALQELKDLAGLLVKSEEWLATHIQNDLQLQGLQIPKKVIQSLIRELNDSLILTAKTYPDLFNEPGSKHTLSRVSRIDFAQIHKKLKLRQDIPGRSFIILLKLLKRAYNDLVNDAGFPDDVNTRYLSFATDILDGIEIQHLSKDFVFKESNKQTSGMNANMYLSVFDRLFTPIILLNENNHVDNFNIEAARLFGNLQIGSHLLDKKHQAFKSLKTINDQIEYLKYTYSEECSFELNIEGIEKDGYYKVLVRRSLEIHDDFKGVIIMFLDLTEAYEVNRDLQEAKTKAEEADKLKTSFLANMSHEIRTPMNAIMGFSELMLNSNALKPEQKEFLKLIRNSSKDLLHIIEDIIDIAKLESKQLKIKFKACKIYLILQDLKAVFLETLRKYGTQNEVELEIIVDEKDRDLIILTDGERLKQVISNFLSNAVKFTNKGTIRFGYERDKQSNLTFFVKDTGIGIPQDKQTKIFDRFFQLEEHQALNLGGFGLGLAISKNIINLLGGKIWMTSKVGEGSSFFFRIPYNEANKQLVEKPNSKKAGAKTWSDLRDVRILIAEDDDMNFMFMEEILTKSGAKIVRAVNGLEAINIAESEEDIDVILMDVKMPEVDGLEASKYISMIRPDIPIIAQTAYAMSGDRTRCLESGCSAYITKPIDQSQLFLLIERYIQLRKKPIDTTMKMK